MMRCFDLRFYIKLSAATTIFACFAFQTVLAGPGGTRDGLQVWLRSDTGIFAADGDPVAIWVDQSGQGNDAIHNPLNGFGELPPIFVASNPGLDGQSTIRFDNQNALELNLEFLAGSDYTVFVVNGRDRFGLANFYLAGDSLVDNSNLVLGYEQTGLLRQAHFNNDLDVLVPPYIGVQIWALDTFRFDQNIGRTIFQNGIQIASDGNLLPLVANTGTTLGNFRAFGSTFFFQGDLAEIVIFDRALSDAEIRLVESELADRSGQPYDLDGDGLVDESDNCATIANVDQTDANGDGFGDACVATNASISARASVGPNPEIGIFSRIGARASVGRNAVIGNRVFILAGSQLGDYVSIGTQSIVLPNAIIGDRVTIERAAILPRANLGSDVSVGSFTYIGPRVTIGDGAIIGSQVVILRGATIAPGSIVPDGTFIPPGASFP